MIKETNLNRILYVATGLVIAVVLMLAFIVIPFVRVDTSPGTTPERAVPVFWVIVIIHLLFVAALVYSILVNQQGGRVSKGLLVTIGILLILFGLTMSDGAFAYLGHSGHGMRTVAVSMFICIGFNLIAGVLAFVATSYSGKLPPSSN